ncbi:hypothetical protein BD626DRAFT_225858 [Schizophyllum amplum]|uniref:Uncharacterized protein n=1 Tax=Schizophyllum amplum TaxID=97359 RepID=A0A550BX13_9AGAR|nr:hypothetical protein BD626DRAFT_225858 [Auriculariopsis ampla]
MGLRGVLAAAYFADPSGRLSRRFPTDWEGVRSAAAACTCAWAFVAFPAALCTVAFPETPSSPNRGQFAQESSCNVFSSRERRGPGLYVARIFSADVMLSSRRLWRDNISSSRERRDLARPTSGVIFPGARAFTPPFARARSPRPKCSYCSRKSRGTSSADELVRCPASVQPLFSRRRVFRRARALRSYLSGERGREAIDFRPASGVIGVWALVAQGRTRGGVRS